MPRAVRIKTWTRRAAVAEDGRHVTCALGHALAGVRLTSDELLPAVRRISTKEAR